MHLVKLIGGKIMAKILIVEDDKRQLEWARSSLSNHTVLSVENWLGFSSFGKESLDLIITDLMIPEDDKEEGPKARFGLRVFLEAICLLSQQKIKGMALISNYEHHAHNLNIDNVCEDDLSSELMHNMKLIFGSIGKKVSNTYQTENTSIRDLWQNDDSLNVYQEGPMNIVFIYDLPFYSYSFFFDTKTKKAIKRKDFVKGVENQYDYIMKSIKEGGCIPLKPYKEIVKALGF